MASNRNQQMSNFTMQKTRGLQAELGFLLNQASLASLANELQGLREERARMKDVIDQTASATQSNQVGVEWVQALMKSTIGTMRLLKAIESGWSTVDASTYGSQP